MGREATKFEVGDIIVPLEYAGMPLGMTDIWKVSDKDSGEYGLQGIAQIGREYYSFGFVEDNYAHIDSLLWYWEHKDALGDYTMLCVDGAPIRTSKSEAIKIRNAANFQDVNNLYPILSTGFRLQKQKKDE